VLVRTCFGSLPSVTGGSHAVPIEYQAIAWMTIYKHTYV
jgi:hypothetical protein